jgi:hypothetical protein
VKHLRRILLRVLYWVQALAFLPAQLALLVSLAWAPYWLLTGRNVFSDYTNWQPLSFKGLVPTNGELDRVGKVKHQRDRKGRRMHTTFGTGHDSAFGSGDRSLWDRLDD